MSEAEKGGRLAQRAAMLCQEGRFYRYLDARLRWETGMSIEALPDGTASQQDAIEFLRARCGVASRAELDHRQEAGAMFRRIVTDYQRWVRRQERGRRG